MRYASFLGLVISLGAFGCGAPKSAPPPMDPTVTVRPENKPPPPLGATAVAGAKARGASEDGDVESARGSLTGDAIGEAFGEGGLGLAGVGEGGGGTGDGIGLGTVGTLGRGGGTGQGQGYGSGSGRLGGSSSGSRGKVAGATALTSGSGLPPEVIQRIVKTRLGVIRACYEKAMEKSSTLAGKIAVKFTIDAQGAVSSASAADTTIADADMVTCVLSAVRSLNFPQPENGAVMIVTYPFNFAPGDG